MIKISKMLVLVLPGFFIWAGCGMVVEDETNTNKDDEELTTSAMLEYEGNCAHLAQCSAYSQNGVVHWGCGDVEWPVGPGVPPPPSQQGCSNSMQYVAAPKNTGHDYCGMEVQLCKNSPPYNCIKVRPVDVSFDPNNRWEGSGSVMGAFNASYSEAPSCSVGGTGMLGVTATMGQWDTTRDAPHKVMINAGASYQLPIFSPGKVGENAIEFVNDKSVSVGGTLEFCWSSNSSLNWSCWTTDTVTYGYKRRILWSGSTDVRYRLTIKAMTSTTFSWRQYKAP